MTVENKVVVVAPIDVQQYVATAAQEKAAVLAFPEEKQGDLQYIRSILVSAGTNKNGAHFLPSELMLAHNTIVNKAIDLEHDESKVIGHIYDCAFLFKDGEVFDPKKLMAEYKESSRNPDEIDIDIAVAGVLHKMRFSEIAEEVNKGDWKVSMECYFKDFDIKVGNQIISRKEAQALGYAPEDLIGGFVKVMAGQKALGKHFVARVLRNITFSGMGLVKNPANPHSIILETAAHKELMEKGDVVINLESIDNLRGHKIEVGSQVEGQVEKTEEMSDTLVRVEPIVDGFSVAANLDSSKIYVELDEVTGGIKRVLSVAGKEEAGVRWSGPGIGGPGSITSWPDELCKSFKKRVTKFNALDQSEAVVLQEHWCALFEEPCPVIGASAKAPECLRNQRNSVTKNPNDTTLNKTVREHLAPGPGNTFTTTLGPQINPISPVHASVNPEDRRTQTANLRTQALELRNSLREFIAAEKKTSE
jgi:hypothetical protein